MPLKYVKCPKTNLSKYVRFQAFGKEVIKHYRITLKFSLSVSLSHIFRNWKTQYQKDANSVQSYP